MPTQSDIDRLIAAVIEPFRPKKPRTCKLMRWKKDTHIAGIDAIELTDEVKARLSETAGVDRDDVYVVLEVTGAIEYASKITDAIMALIAKGKVDYENSTRNS